MAKCPTCDVEMFASMGGRLICPVCGRGATQPQPRQERPVAETNGRPAAGREAPKAAALGSSRIASWIGGGFFLFAIYQAGVTFDWFTKGGESPGLAPWLTALGVVLAIVAASGGPTRAFMAVGVLALVLGAARAYDLAWTSRKEARAKAFASRFDADISLNVLDVLEGDRRDPPPVPGPVVIVDVRARTLDASFFHLPPAVQATNASDVRTVVLADCQERVVGEYRRKGATSGDAYQFFCDVRAVDPVARRVLARKAFTGSPPPSELTSTRSPRGTRPEKEIADYVIGLVERGR